MIGQTISHYKILEKLGEGGMGEVYLAEDTELDRKVALKFLSSSAIAGEEERKRFKREAKAAAALNHQNIAHIYAIDETDGQMFLAMEFIEGKTLDELTDSPLPFDKAIDHTTQISAGLQVAHEKGIVHRDIKSANIMVTDQGVIKIMDFGLAKLANRSRMTRLGTTLGTAAYMSPEQSRGEEADHRSDIWSLGVVLYEIISGQMPFKGDYEQAVIYSIQNEEPEPLTAVRTGVPMKLEEIVNKLLAKDPRNRYQNIMELPVDLKSVNVVKTTGSQIKSSGIRETIEQKKQLNVRVDYSYKTILTITAFVLMTFLLTWFLKPGPPPPEANQANKIAISLPENVSFYFSNSNRMAISPDGTKMVFMTEADGSRPLFIKKPGNFEIEKLARTERARSPFFSPDGRWIGYFDDRTDDEIYKISVDGGEPLMITKATQNLNGATWAPDNTIIFANVGGLKRVPESGGEVTLLTKTRSENEAHSFPHMLADGQTVLFTVTRLDAELNDFRLAVYTFGEDDYQVVLEGGYNGVYSPTGHILYGRSNRLMGVPFDLKNLRVSGVPVPLLDNVQTHRYWGGMSYALSRGGTIIYVPGTRVDDDLRSVLNVDLSGKATEFFKMRKGFEFVRYSPDGNYVAFSIREKDNDANIWIYDVEGEALSQLTFYTGGGVSQFAWSPDSKILAYATQAEDSTNSIYIRNADGTGTAQKIYTSPLAYDMYLKAWSSDGNKLSFDHRSEFSSWDISIYSFQDSSAKPFLATPAYEAGPNFSPNGKWIAYASNVSRGAGGGMEIYVRPYPKSSGGVWKISKGGGNQPLWSRDGKKIYYKNGDVMFSVDVTATNRFSNGNPEKIFEGNYFVPYGRRFDIHPDGDKFIMIQRPEETSPDQKIFVIQNFSEELKRLVPTAQ
jgi:serine/threonine-protein kinase